MTAITFLQDLSRSGDTVDLQKILELKGLKKAEMERMMESIKDTSERMLAGTMAGKMLKKGLGS